MKPKVILVNGFPASGKSTLAQKLADDLAIPHLGKDHLKEFLGERLKVRGDEWSTILGRASSDMLMAMLAAVIGKETILLESAFMYEFAHRELGSVLERNATPVLEIYCTVEREERIRRWHDRIQTGNRHHIQNNNEMYVAMSEAEMGARYAPLKLGRLITVDTTHFGDNEYGVLAEDVKEFLESEVA